MVRLFFKLLRYFNKGIPTRREVHYLIKHDKFNGGKKIQLYGVLYCIGFTLEEIGKTQNVTRERIRQCLLKGCRKPSVG